MPEERLQKLLAQVGIASRRASEDLIRQGRVTINGQRANVGDKADPFEDIIRVDGEVVSFETVEFVYIMLNKPAGIVSAASAQRQEKRPTVIDLVQVEERVYPVGRLDADSEGLTLLTNDGDLTQRLTHPRYGHQKTYRVLVEGSPTAQQLEKWEKGGILLDDGPTAPCTVTAEKQIEAGTWLEIKMGEGRKRQIRRTAYRLGLNVMRLIRTHIGPLKLTGIKPGEWRYLTDAEIADLKRSASRVRLSRLATRRSAGGSSTSPSSMRSPGGKPAVGSKRSPAGGGSSTGGGSRPRPSGSSKRRSGPPPTSESADKPASSGKPSTRGEHAAHDDDSTWEKSRPRPTGDRKRSNKKPSGGRPSSGGGSSSRRTPRRNPRQGGKPQSSNNPRGSHNKRNKDQ